LCACPTSPVADNTSPGDFRLQNRAGGSPWHDFPRRVLSAVPFAKGLEFRAVAVLACDDEVIRLQRCIENVADDADLEEVYDSERHLLYVACTRARDQLFVTGVKPAS